MRDCVVTVICHAGASDPDADGSHRSVAAISHSASGWPVAGLDMDILRRLQQASGIELQVRRMPWGRALKQMQTGQVDLMIGLAYTAERAQFIDYLQPAYYQCWPAFYGQPVNVAGSTNTAICRG